MRNDGGDVVYSQKELTSVLNNAYTASDGKTYQVAFYDLDWNGRIGMGRNPICGGKEKEEGRRKKEKVSTDQLFNLSTFQPFNSQTLRVGATDPEGRSRRP